jgi:hypothetical protein
MSRGCYTPEQIIGTQREAELTTRRGEKIAMMGLQPSQA